MSKLKILENLIRRILQEEKLNEAMKSAKLRKLTSYFPEKVTWRGITDKFKIALDQVTDDQVQVVKGSQAKKILSANPEAIGFFIYVGNPSYSMPKGLMGVKKGTKFVSFYDQYYYPRTNPKDSSIVRGYTPKGGGFDSDSGIRGTVGSSKDQTRGHGRYKTNDGSNFTAGDYWSEDVLVYIIDTAQLSGATTDLKKTRSETGSNFATGEQIKAENANRYRKAIAALRSTEDPDFIKEYRTQLDILNKNVNEAIQKILANPKKFRYGASIDHTVSYGSGSNRRTYTTSLLKLVTEIYGDVDEIIQEFKSGNVKWKEHYSVRNFKENKQKIENIVKVISAYANK